MPAVALAGELQRLLEQRQLLQQQLPLLLAVMEQHPGLRLQQRRFLHRPRLQQQALRC